METPSLYPNLLLAKELLYDRCGFKLTDLKLHKESVEYEACTFRLNDLSVIHRASKTTPTKIGQFVTVWKRSINGETAPLDMEDDFDFVIITASNGENQGQFIFPKSVLLDQRVISAKGKSGKRGIRVYPPWDKPASKQAEKTQHWQTIYFLNIESGKEFNLAEIQRLFKSS
jgi:hypothetical protein